MEFTIFKNIDFSNFWDDSEYSLREYLEDIPTDDLIKSIELELGYKLPDSYIELMKSHNGGIPFKTCFPTKESTSWAPDHVAISGFFGIGRNKSNSLCGTYGNRCIIEDGGYPSTGIYICDCPSSGHDMILLDYSKNGKYGEPEVFHVDQEFNYKKTFLAKDFETFVRGLVGDEVYDTSMEDLKETLDVIKNGKFSDILNDFIKKETSLDFNKILRNLLTELTKNKGYFALHADELSYLVYDIQFYLYSKNRRLTSKEEFLKEYPQLIVFGNGDIKTGGYAPDFIVDWINEKILINVIRTGSYDSLRFSLEYEKELFEKVRKYE